MIAFATSSSFAILYRGIFAAARFFSDSFSYSVRPAYLYRLVSTIHGATAFTLTPYGANSKADAFVSISIPAFDKQ